MYPLDVVRHRMQTEGFVDRDNLRGSYLSSENRQLQLLLLQQQQQQHSSGSGSSRNWASATPSRPSILSTVVHVFQRQGLRGFFKGYSLAWVKGPVTMGVSFTLFDLLKKALAAG